MCFHLSPTHKTVIDNFVHQPPLYQTAWCHFCESEQNIPATESVGEKLISIALDRGSSNSCIIAFSNTKFADFHSLEVAIDRTFDRTGKKPWDTVVPLSFYSALAWLSGPARVLLLDSSHLVVVKFWFSIGFKRMFWGFRCSVLSPDLMLSCERFCLPLIFYKLSVTCLILERGKA